MTSWPSFESLQQVPLAQLGTLKPTEVLYDFDGPCIFASETASGAMVLAYLSEDLDDEKTLRYIIATTSATSVDALKSGAISVRDALDRGSLWLVDFDYHFEPKRAFAVRAEQLPHDAMPDPHTMLWSSLEPALTVRLVGPEIQEGQIPAPVLGQAAKVANTLMKPIFDWAASVLRQASSGRPPEWFRDLYTMRAQRLASGSLVISYAQSKAVEPVQANLPLEEDDFREIQAAGWAALREGLSWAVKPQNEAALLDGDEEKWRAILKSLQQLAPLDRGPVEEVEVWGAVLGGVGQRFTLNRDSTHRIRAALMSVQQHREIQHRVLIGQVRNLDLDKGTLILRNVLGEDTDFPLVLEDDELLGVARVAHYKEPFVSVVARKEGKEPWVATAIEIVGNEELTP